MLFLISRDISLRFGCYGDITVVTPNIDLLASESTVFENHSYQYALCAPSRINLFLDKIGGLNQKLYYNVTLLIQVSIGTVGIHLDLEIP